MSTSTNSKTWALLPDLVLNLVLHKLQCLPDCVRFSSVCTTWRSAAKNTSKKQQFPVPMLLIPIRNSRDKISQKLLYSLQENRTYRVRFPFMRRNARFCGFSQNWLVMVEENFTITLYKPTTKSVSHETETTRAIRLPVIGNIYDVEIVSRLRHAMHFHRHDPTLNQHSIYKVVLSGDPASSDRYVVAAIYGWNHKLAILKSGDRSWTYLTKTTGPLCDVLWHGERLYAVNYHGDVMLIEGVLGKTPSPLMVFSSRPCRNDAEFYLMLSSRGKLLLIESYFKTENITNTITREFKAYKLEMSPVPVGKQNVLSLAETWWIGEILMKRVPEKVNKVEVNEVGGDALFLGENCSVTVADSETCQENCIYHITNTKRYHDWAIKNLGIFRLENEKSEFRSIKNSSLRIHPPIWITPTLSDDWI